jgi:hypothetical protein
VLSTTASALRVRVPEAAGAVGSSVPVVVSMGADASNAFPFLLGRLPLTTGVEPRTVSAGDVVAIAGRGFQAQPVSNKVKIGGAAALVVSSSDAEVKAIVPRGAAPGPDAPVEVKVEGLDNVAQSSVTISPPLDPVDFRLRRRALRGRRRPRARRPHHGPGPAFVLSDSGGRSAAERALEAERRLNAAAIPCVRRAARTWRCGAWTRTRSSSSWGRATHPAGRRRGRGGLQRGLDAARTQGGPGEPRASRAVVGRRGRDLALMLARGESPRHAAGLAPRAGSSWASSRRAADGTVRGPALRDRVGPAGHPGGAGGSWACGAGGGGGTAAGGRSPLRRPPACVR